MSDLISLTGGISPADLSAGNSGSDALRKPKDLGDAAEQFEALLITQMFKSMRESGSGWLGGGDDQAGATMTELAEEHLARSLTANGGFGVAKVIEKQLSRSAK